MDGRGSGGGGPTRAGPKASVAGFFSPTSSSTGTTTGKGSKASSASGWKDRLKERCLKRVQEERSRLVQELRGLTSPPPAGVPARDGAPPLHNHHDHHHAVHSPSPTTLLRPQPGRHSTPSSLSGAALFILQDEMRAGGGAQLHTDGEAGGADAEGAAMMMMMSGGEHPPPMDGVDMTPLRPPTRAILTDEEELERLSPEEQVELMRCIEEALQAEMHAAEQLALEEYARLENHEIEASVEALYDYDALPADNVAVLCPRCKGNFLVQEEGGEGDVLCACGLRVEGGKGPATLVQLQEALAGVYAQHKAVCAVKEPTFFQRGSGDLFMECGVCGMSARVV